jgi:preprotein translocase subunit SecD
MFKKPKNVFIALMVLVVVTGWMSLPDNYTLKLPFIPGKPSITFHSPSIDTTIFGYKITKNLRTRLGLDLAGGSHIALEADMKGIKADERGDALESARQVIERRVNFFGVSEPVVQSAKSGDTYRVIVELPGVTNVDEAVALLGQTAKLEFRQFKPGQEATISAYYDPMMNFTIPTDITGKDLSKAQLSFNTQTGEPEVAIKFTGDGAKKFSDLTTKLIGKPLAIYLDDMLITAPRVNTPITDGEAVITGSFTTESAKQLALQLNAGALPVPVSVVEKRTVGATLGGESVAMSVRAGLIGLGFVALFMILRYGWLGLIADLALVIYTLISIALYRLIPITLTLPGIAGFILSIGMAVDSNILIFERFYEEKRLGKPWQLAMELGFGKAWESIKDANVTTIITSIILYNPGNWNIFPSSGLVRGFAATLFLGVVTSLFTGIVVTRTFIRVLYKEKTAKKV